MSYPEGTNKINDNNDFFIIKNHTVGNGVCLFFAETLPLRCYCTCTQSWLSQFRADGIMQMKDIINV